jgi:3-hydroxybutyrate dehydrogenase
LSILKGKTAVVTGSTSGIGLGCARAFGGAGANIVLNGIGAPSDVEKARSAIENDFGVKAIYSPANMAEPMEIASMITLAEKTFGRVDMLVNNAGIQHVSPIEDFPVEKWDAVIACYSACKFGSDSLLMKSERRLTLVSQRNQCDAASLTSVGPGSSRV